MLWLGPRLVDDAFISFRYAANLADGYGLVFNVGEWVEGFSNLLWTLLLAGASAVGLDPARAAVFLGGILILASIAAAMRMVRIMSGSLAAGIAVGLVLALSPSFIGSGLNGLETALYGAGVTGCCLGLVSGSPAGRWSAAVGGVLVATTRPEGPVLALLLMVVYVWQRVRAGEKLRLALTPAAPVLAAIAGAKLWEHAYYGAWIPNSVTAKRDLDVGPVESLHRSLTPGWHYVQSSLGASWLMFVAATLAVLVVGGAIRRRLQPGPYTGPLVATAFGLAIAVASRGDWMPYGRLLQPYLPVGLACVASGAVVVLRRVTMSGVGIALAVAAWSLTGLLLEPDPSAVVQRFREPVLDNLGRLIRERGEPRDVYAIGVAGRIGYYARPRTVLEMFGLTSPAIARRHIAGTVFGKFVPGEVTKWRPVLIMQNYWPHIQTLLNGTRDRYDLLVTPLAPRDFYVAVRHDRLAQWKRPLERTYDGRVVPPAVGFAKWRTAAPTGG